MLGKILLIMLVGGFKNGETSAYVIKVWPLRQKDKNIFENTYFSQISKAPNIWKFQQIPKRIDKKATLIIVFTVD